MLKGAANRQTGTLAAVGGIALLLIAALGIVVQLQRFLAKRMNAKVTEVASSHVPMLSQPRRVYEVIRDAAVNIKR
jgi:hypothetical protein